MLYKNTNVILVSDTNLKKNVKREKDIAKHMIINNEKRRANDKRKMNM